MNASGPLLRLAVVAFALAGCNDENASIELGEVRANSRDPAGHVILEVDVRAHESFGKSIGTYCTTVTFAGQTDPAFRCDADLKDGDQKTIRVVSENVPDPGTGITVDIILGKITNSGGTTAPPR